MIGTQLKFFFCGTENGNIILDEAKIGPTWNKRTFSLNYPFYLSNKEEWGWVGLGCWFFFFGQFATNVGLVDPTALHGELCFWQTTERKETSENILKSAIFRRIQENMFHSIFKKKKKSIQDVNYSS